MKLQKFAAVNIVFIMLVASLVGCGNSEDEKTSKNSKLYGYYNLLNEEFEKGNISNRGFSNYNYTPTFQYDTIRYESNIIKYKNNIICINSLNNVTVFNIDTKETTDFNVDIRNDSVQSAVFQNGYFYALVNVNYDQEQSKIIKLDINGETVSQCSLDEVGYAQAIRCVLSNGTVVFDTYSINNYNSNIYNSYLISSDFQKITKIPKPRINTIHGLTEKVDSYHWAGSDGTKAYAYNESAAFCFDTETFEWKQTGTLDKAPEAKYTVNMGKYLVITESESEKKRSEFIDLETCETISVCNVPSSLSDPKLLLSETEIVPFYSCSGLSHHILIDKTWYNVRFPGNGKDAKLKRCKPLGKETTDPTHINLVDDTYYTVTDAYGCFLRTYEKGEAEEETIYLSENKRHLFEND